MADDDTSPFTQEEIARAQSYRVRDYPEGTSPEVDALVKDIITGFADKWTFVILDVLWDKGTLRFSEIWREVPEISQKMLTQTLRLLERDGVVARQVYAEVPPRVDYALTKSGVELSEALCGVWEWAIRHVDDVAASRRAFDGQAHARQGSDDQSAAKAG